MLENPNEPVSDLSYFDCIESVMENSKVSLSVLTTGSQCCDKIPSKKEPEEGRLYPGLTVKAQHGRGI